MMHSYIAGRRGILMQARLVLYTILAVLIGTILPIDSFSQQLKKKDQPYVEGTVYEDASRNGRFDEGESGLSGVPVSNQHEVVRTDKQGDYRLPLHKENIIFVTKPAGYKFKRNTNNLPQFYYIYQPAGSPEGLKYAGVEPTGKLPESVNFGLIKTKKRNKFTAIAFGDPQPRDYTELSYFRDDVADEMLGVKADMSIVLGDMMFNDLSMYGRYNRIMGTMGLPVYNIIGNHDLNFKSVELDKDANRYANETFKRFYGPTYYSFNYGQVHFIALDDIDYFEDPDEKGTGAYRGSLSNKQLQWIENDLSNVPKDKLLVLMAHIPLYEWNGDEPYMNIMNRNKLVPLLDEYSNVLFICGHIHMNYRRFLKEEIGRKNHNPIHHIAMSAASGTWWGGPKNEYGIPVTTQRDGVPNGYHILRFEKNRYTERYKAAGFGKDYQMRIELPDSILSAKKLADAEIVVNVFNGSERSRVEYRINNAGSWNEMQQVANKGMSPFVSRLQKRTSEAHPNWISPVRTNHLWKADLPNSLDKGMNTITVRTTDMFGNEFQRSKILEIK